MSRVISLRVKMFALLSALCFGFWYVLSGQSDTSVARVNVVSKPVLRVAVLNGRILKQERVFLLSKNDNGDRFEAIRAFSIEYGWQMWGGPAWVQAGRYPRLGFGAQYLRILKRDELGHPFSVYGFYDGIYFRWKNLEFTNRLSAGLSYGVKTYDPNQSLPNDIFSTKVNSFVELGFGFAFRLHQFLYIEPGFRLTHLSNGNIREPQNGLNIVSYSLGIRSAQAPMSTYPIKVPLPKSQHRHELVGFLGVSTRQMEFMNQTVNYPHETFGMNFLMTTLHIGYNYELGRRFKIGGGVDIAYDGTHGQHEIARTKGVPDKRAVPFQDRMRYAVFVGGENAIDKFVVVTTLGYIVAQTHFDGSTPAFEQRLGLKYHIYKNVFAGVNVRAYNFRSAQAMEFNIGMRKPLSRKAPPSLSADVP